MFRPQIRFADLVHGIHGIHGIPGNRMQIPSTVFYPVSRGPRYALGRRHPRSRCAGKRNMRRGNSPRGTRRNAEDFIFAARTFFSGRLPFVTRPKQTPLLQRPPSRGGRFSARSKPPGRFALTGPHRLIILQPEKSVPFKQNCAGAVPRQAAGRTTEHG